MRQSRETFSSRSRAPSEFCCEHFHPSPCDMTLSSPLTSLPLKRKRAARGTRAPRAPSIVDSFSRLPSQAFAVGSVAPDVCPLVLVAARVPFAALHGDAQSDSRRATTRDEPADVETAV